MSALRVRSFGPLTQAVAGFLALCAISLGFGLARRAGLVGPDIPVRVSGAVIGLMAVLVGNIVPKARPLGSAGGDAARAASLERAAARALVLVGVSFVGLFAFSPLDDARRISAVLGLGTMALLAVDAIRLLAGGPRGDAPRSREVRTGLTQRTIAANLLFGVLFLLLTASLKALWPVGAWNAKGSSWWVPGYLVAYSLLQIVYAPWHRRAHRPDPPTDCE